MWLVVRAGTSEAIGGIRVEPKRSTREPCTYKEVEKDGYQCKTIYTR